MIGVLRDASNESKHGGLLEMEDVTEAAIHIVRPKDKSRYVDAWLLWEGDGVG